MTQLGIANTRVISSRTGLITRVKNIWIYRELLVALTRKELKVKYKNSILGFVWSLLNPLMYLVIFYVLFSLILKNGIPFFAILLLCALLFWNFFQNSVMSATGNIVANQVLVNKVYFPRETLALAPAGANLVHFFLQSLVLLVFMAAFQRAPNWGSMWLLIPALIAGLLLTAGLSILLSAVNVYFRDTQHLMELVLLAWFWFTPIVWPFVQQLGGLKPIYQKIALLNPAAPIVLTFQKVLYAKPIVPNTSAVSALVKTGMTNAQATAEALKHPATRVAIFPIRSDLWYLRNLGFVAVVSALLLVFALWAFGRLEANFPEEF